LEIGQFTKAFLGMAVLGNSLSGNVSNDANDRFWKLLLLNVTQLTANLTPVLDA